MDHEADKRKGIIVQHDAPDVADNLRETPEQHTRHEPPAAPSPAQIGMDGGDDAKRSGEEDVGRQRRAKAVDAPFHGADGQGAVGVGAKRHELGRDLVHCC